MMDTLNRMEEGVKHAMEALRKAEHDLMAKIEHMEIEEHAEHVFDEAKAGLHKLEAEIEAKLAAWKAKRAGDKPKSADVPKSDAPH
jgi:hypothetical protein